MKNNWFVLKKESQYQRLKQLLQEHPMVEIGQVSTFTLMGYKNITPEDKETYFFLCNLSSFNKANTGNHEISTSLHFIALSLGTTIRTQINRINRLCEVGLLKKARKRFKHNTYIVNHQPLPDSTLVKTLLKIVRRKRLINLLQEHKNTSDVATRDFIKSKILSRINNPFYKEIAKEFTEFKNFILK